jgi:hypothetical protein
MAAIQMSRCGAAERHRGAGLGFHLRLRYLPFYGDSYCLVDGGKGSRVGSGLISASRGLPSMRPPGRLKIQNMQHHA